MEWKNNSITEIQQIIANNKTYIVIRLLTYETRSTLYSVTCIYSYILTSVQISYKKCLRCFRNWNTHIKARTTHITAKIAHVTSGIGLISDQECLQHSRNSKMLKTAHLLIHHDFLDIIQNSMCPNFFNFYQTLMLFGQDGHMCLMYIIGKCQLSSTRVLKS